MKVYYYCVCVCVNIHASLFLKAGSSKHTEICNVPVYNYARSRPVSSMYHSPMYIYMWWNGQSGTQYITIVPLYIAICRAYLLFHPASLHNCLQHIILVPSLSAQYYRLTMCYRAQHSIPRLPAKRML